MNLKQIEVFIQVADTGSFSMAARNLFLTQPTISSQINNLEQELNCKLFERTTKEVKITENGEKLIPYARQMIELKSQIERAFYRDNETKNEVIAIAASTIPSKYIIPDLCANFSKDIEDITFKVWEGDSQNVEEIIAQGKYQIGFTGTRQDDHNCKYYPIYEDELVVITPNDKKYQKLDGKISLDEIVKSPLVFREEGSGTRYEIEKALLGLQVDLQSLHIAASFKSQEAIIKAVRANMGISIVSKLAVDEAVKEEKILMFKFPDTELKRTLYLVNSKEYTLTNKEKKFVKYVKEHYKVEKN